ncbi:hypothetical protein H4R20_000652 [Coemansia guatemalensis]|uniref:Uncharacterized protein n=1 Tax=Coemansia guatemalensis TaxID=2761395 RepID=A0A9W8I0Q7_9FUNG|nr:hypothetical protein H4R20_000652 [Coemansia guatemalensis]
MASKQEPQSAAYTDSGAEPSDAVDIESAKRNLQALVTAGIHAHDLLGQHSDKGDEDEDANSASSDEDDGGTSSDGSDGGQPAGYADAEVAHGPEAEDGGAAAAAGDLLSRVANSFRALIGHGLTTAGARGGADGLSDAAALDDDGAYALAREALERNLRYQRMLRAQVATIESAQRRNTELQEGIGALLSQQGRASGRRGGRRGREERGAVDPVTGEARIAPSTFFVDVDGQRPPDNRDTVRRQKHPPIVYRARRWTDAERDALVRGVRQSNRKILSQRLFQQTQDPRSIWEVEKMTDAELEMNLAGLDWKYISRQFVPQHKPVECAIQWATQDHPIINRAPWTKKEERALGETVERHGGRDWVAIAKELGTQRTASQCFQVFQRKLNADMSRSKWSPEEDRVLTEAVMAYGEGDWQAVAACLDNRTGQQVLHRWCKSINPAIRSGRWDRDEDVALLAAVRLYGVGQWTKIAKHVPGRTDVKCRERYMNVLTPDVNNAQWSADEDARLVAIVARVGIGKWSYVADLLGGRTDNQCWRHWRSLHKRGKAPDPPAAADESGEEGTVPSFPEWEAERRRAPLSPAHDDAALLGFAHTQGVGRKRKSMSGIESARKRQWKRATSTNFVPLLASPASPDAPPDTPTRAAAPPRARSSADARRRRRSLDDTPSRHARPAAMTPTPATAAPARRAPGPRRGRVLNWNNILQVAAEAKSLPSPDAHIRPVLPSLATVQGLLRLVDAVPEVAAAFNAELVGIDADDGFGPSMDSLSMAWLRQRIESLFIWPLMLGSLDTHQRR